IGGFVSAPGSRFLAQMSRSPDDRKRDYGESMSDSSATASARSAASRLHENGAFQFAARAGFAVNGLLHLLIGGIAFGVAFGSGEDADQSGALGGLALTPAGLVVLWVVAVGHLALGLFE